LLGITEPDSKISYAYEKKHAVHEELDGVHNKKSSEVLGAVHKKVRTKLTPSSLSEKFFALAQPPPHCPCEHTINFAKIRAF